MGFSLAKMITPPKSKSIWQAMTEGSTGGWAASLSGASKPIAAAASLIPVVGAPASAAIVASDIGHTDTSPGAAQLTTAPKTESIISFENAFPLSSYGAGSTPLTTYSYQIPPLGSGYLDSLILSRSTPAKSSDSVVPDNSIMIAGAVLLIGIVIVFLFKKTR